MAQQTRAALDSFEAEHAPQKEGDPTGKSTVEKGFDSLKRIAEPLLALSGRLAALVPQLRSPDLAVPFARLVVATVLRAYQAGARAARRAFDARGDVSEDTLVRAAAHARETARADDRSARLLLSHLHAVLRFEGSCRAFADSFRRYPLDVLRSAEIAFCKRLLLPITLPTSVRQSATSAPLFESSLVSIARNVQNATPRTQPKSTSVATSRNRPPPRSPRRSRRLAFRCTRAYRNAFETMAKTTTMLTSLVAGQMVLSP